MQKAIEFIFVEMVEVLLMLNILQQSLQEDIKLKEEDYQELLLQQIQVH